MKQLTCIGLIILLTMPAWSQRKKNTDISLNTSAFNSATFEGKPGGDWNIRYLERTIVIGAGYRIGFNHWLSLATGLEYTGYRFTWPDELIGQREFAPYQQNLNLLSIPLIARADFLKYVFIQAGSMIDVQVSKQVGARSFSGMGVQVGAGLRYDTKSNIGFFINPNFQWHGLLKFQGRFPNQGRLNSSCIRLGISYRL